MSFHAQGSVWRAHPAFGFLRVDQPNFMALTEDDLSPEWLALPEAEQLCRENDFYLRLMLGLAASCRDATMAVDVSDHDDESILRHAGFTKIGPSRYAGEVSPTLVRALLRTNPTWMVITCDGKEIALVADTWDGFHLLVDPSEAQLGDISVS